ncbi:MAG: biotin--[acetyl-CoA-carboxylase] ligase [Planctomycetes bacterium]|nr:biotin--[acetyl-CoA-carboxylase] ligase [Planctomycetota bacterium]
MRQRPASRAQKKRGKPAAANSGFNPAIAILAILYDRPGQFTSIDELADLTSRDAAEVRSALERLSEAGHGLDFSPASGVSLRRPVKLDGHLIERGLDTRRIGRNVIVFDELDSTNDAAFSAARQAGADGLVVLAESQRAGRGRLGRKWLSQPGGGILMSVLLAGEPELPQEALTIAAGLSVAQAAGRHCRADCLLKWPNDVMIDSLKLAGVLVEVRAAGAARATVVGIGVNVYSAPPESRLGRPAACLADHASGQIERIDLVRDILRILDGWIGEISRGRLDQLKNNWLERSAMPNSRITVQTGGRKVTGRVIDVSPLDGLILMDDAGNRHILPAGTTTVLE